MKDEQQHPEAAAAFWVFYGCRSFGCEGKFHGVKGPSLQITEGISSIMGLRCEKHPYSAPGVGVCAVCLRQKLAKLAQANDPPNFACSGSSDTNYEVLVRPATIVAAAAPSDSAESLVLPPLKQTQQPLQAILPKTTTTTTTILSSVNTHEDHPPVRSKTSFTLLSLFKKSDLEQQKQQQPSSTPKSPARANVSFISFFSKFKRSSTGAISSEKNTSGSSRSSSFALNNQRAPEAHADDSQYFSDSSIANKRRSRNNPAAKGSDEQQEICKANKLAYSRRSSYREKEAKVDKKSWHNSPAKKSSRSLRHSPVHAYYSPAMNIHSLQKLRVCNWSPVTIPVPGIEPRSNR